jgi:hypothetical protein
MRNPWSRRTSTTGDVAFREPYRKLNGDNTNF